MEDIFDANLFTSTEYKLHKYQYKYMEQSLLYLNSGSTDFDMTGQVVWSAAHLLSNYIVDNSHRFQNKRILELGAGAGQVGLIASHFAQKVVVTDYQPIIIDLLRQNAQFAKNSFEVKSFLWGDHEQLDKDIQDIDMVIGSDVIFWPDCVRPLYSVQILIASHRRSKSVEKQVFDVCEEMGICYKIILQKDDDILMELFLKQ